MVNFYQGSVQLSIHLFARIDVLARRRFISILTVFFLSFGGSWVWSLFHGIPVPVVHDEFSYLLASDTFAHGRLTNPTPPTWEYFETNHELMKPTYMSKYPPGQGLFLALGQAIFGQPVYGVWLSAGLMCASICWMLYAWVSPRWALIGGLVSALQFGIFTYWSQSYWGGAVAGLGGALVLGALPRIFRTQRLRDAMWLGVGCAILANSRPLEGFLVMIPLACLVMPWKIKWKKLVLAHFAKIIILPLSGILVITILGMGAYNKAITGHASVFPYFAYAQTYREVPIFLWQPLAPKVKFNNKLMEYQEEKSTKIIYLSKRSWDGFIRHTGRDLIGVSTFFFGYPLALPSLSVLTLFFFYRKTAVRFGLALFLLLSACAAMTTEAKAHYFSPLTSLAVYLVTIGLKGLAQLKLRNARVGLLLVVFLIVYQLALNIVLTPTLPLQSQATIIYPSPVKLFGFFSREELKDFLVRCGGKYLVTVQYPPGHNYFWDWVYNDADIDHAPIVWAQDMGEGNNKKLLEYFKGRQLLTINVASSLPGFPDYQARQ